MWHRSRQSLTNGFAAAAAPYWHVSLIGASGRAHKVQNWVSEAQVEHMHTWHVTWGSTVWRMSSQLLRPPIDMCHYSLLPAPCTQPLMAPMIADWLLSMLCRYIKSRLGVKRDVWHQDAILTTRHPLTLVIQDVEGNISYFKINILVYCKRGQAVMRCHIRIHCPLAQVGPGWKKPGDSKEI